MYVITYCVIRLLLTISSQGFGWLIWQCANAVFVYVITSRMTIQLPIKYTSLTKNLRRYSDINLASVRYVWTKQKSSHLCSGVGCAGTRM